MKKIILVLLVAFSLEHAPFRLIAVSAQALVIPGGYIRLGGGTDRYWEAKNVELQIVRYGWRVEYVSGLAAQGIYGLANPGARTIQIDADLDWNDRLSVLAHEGGHMLQRGVLSQGQGEVFAESVAALVVRGGHREHARYLSMFKSDLMTALACWREIYWAADFLRGR